MTQDTQTRQFVVDRTQSLLAANQAATALAVGQMGIFDLNTGLSVGSTGIVDSFQIGMGMGSGGLLQDIVFSPQLQANGSRYIVESDCYKPALGNVIVLHDFKVKCNTDYSIQLVVNTNMSRSLQGAQPIRKSYPVVTSCCTDDCTCGEGVCTDLGIRYAQAIKNDPDALVNVWLVDNVDALDIEAQRIDPNDAVAIAAAIDAAPDPALFCFALHIEPIVETMNSFCGLIWGGGHEWQISGLPFYQVTLAKTTGHQCMGTITTIREAVYGGTTLADVNQQEYFLDQNREFGIYRAFENGRPTGENTVQPKLGASAFSVISLYAKNTHHIGDNDRTHIGAIQFMLPCSQSGAGPLSAIQAFLLANKVVDNDDFAAAVACTCT